MNLNEANLLERADAEVLAAKEQLQSVGARQAVPKNRMRELNAKADQARSAAEALRSEDRSALLARIVAGDESAEAELLAKESDIARLELRAGAFLQAAKECTPAIAAFSDEIAAAQRRCQQARLARTHVAHLLAAEAVEQYFAGAVPLIAEFIRTGRDLESVHRDIFKEPLNILEARDVNQRLARFLNVWCIHEAGLSTPSDLKIQPYMREHGPLAAPLRGGVPIAT